MLCERDTYTVSVVVLRRHRRILLAKQLELPLQHLNLHTVPLSQLLDMASGVVHAYRTECQKKPELLIGGRGEYHGRPARSRNMAAVAFISIFSTRLVDETDCTHHFPSSLLTTNFRGDRDPRVPQARSIFPVAHLGDTKKGRERK